jgi:hypothetical protein
VLVDDALEGCAHKVGSTVNRQVIPISQVATSRWSARWEASA